MRHQDAGRMSHHRRRKHLPRMHHCTGQRAFRNLFGFDDAVFGIQQYDQKLLVRLIP